MPTKTKTQRRNAAQLAADGFAAIVERLGMADAVRYVQLYHHGAGDYARERHEWLDQVGHDQLVDLMARTHKSKTRRRVSKKTQKVGR
jgi:hypothetical protein